ncbi:short chain dehydrogenase [Variovorax sp. IB41]|uniref:short chain dehydrogenase n=1 Tax=Variovorax sp. IB41 TaxID=2779370 RepID=UPI0018E8CB36|nr:short chain dehydrogenase [Variovorax sp. IB41]MBJ2157489.1 short chain dehydrogenase [Variovorax sp. IB41]
MKILVVGATGAIGSAVAQVLADRGHEVVRAGRTRGDAQVDITNDASVQALYAAVGRVDAIVSATGGLFFGPLADMRPADFNVGLQDKLLGQVRLALLGQHVLADGGSITLTTGVAAEDPVRGGSNAAAVNAGVEGFVKGAAIELPRGLRINAVSPTLLTESLAAYGALFPGVETVPAARVALAYVRSIEGPLTGRVLRVWQ